MSLRSTSLVALALSVGGCVAAPDSDIEQVPDPEPDLLTVALRGDCEEWGCGSTNSPEIDHVGMHDFLTDGRANAAGFVLESYSKFGMPYTLDVTGAKLTGKDNMGRVVIYGDGPGAWPNSLVGSEIILKFNPNPQVMKRYKLTIEAVTSVTNPQAVEYFAKPNGATKLVETLYVRWVQINKFNQPIGEAKNICKNPPADAGRMNVHHLILFGGDVIDSRLKTVSGSIDAHRVNIGCADHALAKLHLFGHTYGAQKATENDADKFVTTTQERTTVLKSVVGDYCGTGDTFTLADTPLNYKDDKAWVVYPGVPPTLDARWDKNGARCVGTLRLEAHSTPESRQVFPFLRDEIKAQCLAAGHAFLACASTPSDLQSGHWNTANP